MILQWFFFSLCCFFKKAVAVENAVYSKFLCADAVTAARFSTAFYSICTYRNLLRTAFFTATAFLKTAQQKKWAANFCMCRCCNCHTVFHCFLQRLIIQKFAVHSSFYSNSISKHRTANKKVTVVSYVCSAFCCANFCIDFVNRVFSLSSLVTKTRHYRNTNMDIGTTIKIFSLLIGWNFNYFRKR